MKTEEEPIIRKFNGKEVSFQFLTQDVMVNATEMAKVFGKRLNNFMRLESTTTTIDSIIRSQKFQNYVQFNYLTSEVVKKDYTYEELKKFVVYTVEGQYHSGTFMHRKLALKFAAWLDPDFDFWIFDTIEELLFNNNLSGVVEFIHSYPYHRDQKKIWKQKHEEVLNKKDPSGLRIRLSRLVAERKDLVKQQEEVKTRFVQADLFQDADKAQRNVIWDLIKKEKEMVAEIDLLRKQMKPIHDDKEVFECVLNIIEHSRAMRLLHKGLLK